MKKNELFCGKSIVIASFQNVTDKLKDRTTSIIVSVGRKYFYTQADNSIEVRKFSIETMREETKFSQWENIAFLSSDGLDDHVEKMESLKDIERFFSVGFDKSKLSLEAIRIIKKEIDNVQ